MWLRVRIGRRRIGHSEMVQWRRSVAALKTMTLDSSVILTYWGWLAYRPPQLRVWARHHYLWHGKAYRA